MHGPRNHLTLSTILIQFICIGILLHLWQTDRADLERQTDRVATLDEKVEILTAENGQEGLDMVKATRPALVLLDVMMPMMNGYDVCNAIREDPDVAGVQVILLTAKGQEADRERGVSVGASRYMTKPFDPDELLEIAKDMLGLDE